MSEIMYSSAVIPGSPILNQYPFSLGIWQRSSRVNWVLPSTIRLIISKVNLVDTNFALESPKSASVSGVKLIPSNPVREEGMRASVHLRWGHPLGFIPQSLRGSWESNLGRMERGSSKIGSSVCLLLKSKGKSKWVIFKEASVEDIFRSGVEREKGFEWVQDKN